MSPKLKLKLPKISFRTITSGLFILIIILELFITFKYLYKNFQPEESTSVPNDKIIRADLKGYSQIYNDLTSRTTYQPSTFEYKNSNPFKYGP
jgi:hypothetical protein